MPRFRFSWDNIDVSLRATLSSYYIQFAMGGDEGVRIETVANAYLTRYERFSQESQLRLVELGWQPPTRLPGEAPDDPSGSPNYFHDYPVPTPFDEVAATTVRTPAVLEYLAFWTTGSPIELPDLEIDEEERKPSPEVKEHRVAAAQPDESRRVALGGSSRSRIGAG
jgi:hypothetical protein